MIVAGGGGGGGGYGGAPGGNADENGTTDLGNEYSGAAAMRAPAPPAEKAESEATVLNCSVEATGPGIFEMGQSGAPGERDLGGQEEMLL